MIFRWKCNKCGKEIKEGKDRLKVIKFENIDKKTKTKHEGDLCNNCWKKINLKN